MTPIQKVLVPLLGAELLVELVKAHVPDAVRMDEWARKNSLVLLSAERRYFLKGPFSFRNGLVVYRIRVSDSASVKKTGWLCTKNLFWQLGTEAKWDEHQPA